MFVGVVVENFHKCRESQEKEEKARRAAKRAKKLERKRRSMSVPLDVLAVSGSLPSSISRRLHKSGWYCGVLYRCGSDVSCLLLGGVGATPAPITRLAVMKTQNM